MSQLSDLSDLINVINTVRGRGQTTTTSGGRTTQRQQTEVSDQGVQQIIADILSGPGGVRSVGGAARSAGMYDSTTEDMMLGDLYARAANRAELARSPTVTTTDTPEVVQETAMPGMGLGSLAATLAGTSALSSIMRGEVPFAGAMEGIQGIMGGGGGGFGGMGGIGEALGSVFGGGGGAAGGAALPGGFMGQVATGGGSGAAIPGGFMSQIGGGSAGAGGFMSQLGGTGTMLPGAGGLFSGLTQEEEALDSPGKLLGTAGTGFMAGGPMGAAAAVTGAILGSALKGGSIQGTIANIPVVGDVLDPIIGGVRSVGRSLEKGVRSVGRSIGKAVGTVICTALMYRGHLDKEEYRQALRLMHELHPTALRGYHSWAVGVAQKIRQGHKLHTAIWKPIMRSRMKLLGSGGGFWNHLRYPLGTGTKYILEPGCYLIGKYLEFRDGPQEGYDYGRN